MRNAVVSAIVAFGLTICLQLSIADAEIIRTPDFPPKLMIRTYKSFNRTCREESQVTQESINGFNDGEDFDKLPNDRPLKCYMLCQMLHMEMMEPNSATLKIDNAVENIHAFSGRDKDIFLNMSKRCTRLKSKTKDSCDLAYDFNKCMKKGDINSYFLL